MAGADKQPLTARVDTSTIDQIEAVQADEGHDDRSAAVRAVIHAGIREKHGPVQQRWRSIAFDAAYHLTLVAVMLVVVGFGTSILPPARGTALALVTVTVAIAPIAALELWRLVSGQASVGAGTS